MHSGATFQGAKGAKGATGTSGYGGRSGSSSTSWQVVSVKALREDQLQLSSGHLPWNVLGLASPPQLWGAKAETSATLQWKLHICSAKSQVTDWAVGDRNSLQGVLGQLGPLQLRTGIFSLELSVSPGASLPVSWAAVAGRTGSSAPELLHFAPPFSVCATHRSPDAHVLCRALCPDAYEAVRSRSTADGVVATATAAAYADAWKGLVELEAVASAVDEGLGRHLTDVWVDWEKSDEGLLGQFEVKAALLFAHKMKFRSAMPLGEWASSWLCVRRHLKGSGGRPWHGHGAVIKASFDEKDLLFADEDETWQDSNSNLRVTFRLLPGSGSVEYPEQGFYLLELIPKALSESCMALALGEVAQCPLVQNLVLDGRQRGAELSVSPSRNGLALAESLQASFEALMEQLNESQRSAVEFALKHSLAQVQGPPGTGKTMTTAVLATCFAADNMSSGENRAVLLCTPTNRAADCAAAFVAKICSRHAERRLQQTVAASDGSAPCCAVCLREKPDVITLCNHVFHKRCLAQALEVGSRCPICRRHVKHIETGLRILRIYGADIEKQEFPVPKRNEHAGLESRKVVEVPQELRRFSLHWRCHAAAEGERASPEALKTRKAYREMIQHGTKGPRADQLRRSYQQALAEARKVELREADLVFSTCVSCRRMAIAQALSEEGAPAFWQVILDEAGQATEPEALCALTFARSCRQICLFGDQQQLRPILKSQLAEAKGMAVSLFERLTLTHEPQFLAIQYRMTPSISSFPSHQFYQGRLLDDASTERTPTLLLHPLEERSLAMMAWDLGSQGGERVSHTRTVENSAGSRMNDLEAQSVVELALLLASRSGPQAVGILCWYRAQVARVLELLREQGQNSIHVGSVATAQGSEWDYVLLSTVRRGGPSGRLGILADAHILNVALTRARRGLVVLGHEASLSSDLNWKAFFDHCRTKDVLIQGMPRVTSDEEILKESWCRALVLGLEVEVHGLQSQPELNGKTGTIVALENEKGRWEVELPALNGTEEPRRLALKPGNLRLVKAVPLGDPKGPRGPSFGGLNVLVANDRPKETGVEFSTTLQFQALQLEPPPRHGVEVTVVDRNSPCHGLKGTVQSRGQNISGVSVEFCKRFHLQQGPVQVRPGKKGLEVAAQSSVEHLLRRGLVVMLHGLKSKPELNAEWARVVCEEAKEDGRWEVELLESVSQKEEAKRLALKPENLAPEV